MILASKTSPSPQSIDPVSAVSTDFLDSLRAIAALFVMWHHAWLIVWPVGYREYPAAGLAESATTWLSYGHFAVTAFLVVSGFCLALPLVQNRWRDASSFYRRRARRILPPLYAAIAITILLALVAIGRDTGTHWDNSVPVEFNKVWSLFATVGAVVAPGHVNSVYWSIFVETHIYLLFPLIALVWMRASPWFAVLLFGAAAYLLSALVQRTPYQALFPHLLASFLIGCAAAEVSFSTSRVARWLRTNVRWEAIALALVVGVGLYLRPHRLEVSSPWFPWLDLPFSVAIGGLIVAGCARRSTLVRVADTPPLRRIGVFSYSLYLMHFPLMQLVWQFGIEPLHLSEAGQFVALISCGTPIALLGSYGFFLFVERHFLPSRNRTA